MKKIRINELARELEVKPGVILDLLPELGVHEKKTHSSSIDEEVALELRLLVFTHSLPPRRGPPDRPAPRFVLSKKGRKKGCCRGSPTDTRASPFMACVRFLLTA